MSHADRACRGNNPSDLICVLIPQLHAEAHIGDVVQVRICQLTEQVGHAPIEVGVGALLDAGFGANALAGQAYGAGRPRRRGLGSWRTKEEHLGRSVKRTEIAMCEDSYRHLVKFGHRS
jgi:hypothetical protein